MKIVAKEWEARIRVAISEDKEYKVTKEITRFLDLLHLFITIFEGKMLYLEAGSKIQT